MILNDFFFFFVTHWKFWLNPNLYLTTWTIVHAISIYKESKLIAGIYVLGLATLIPKKHVGLVVNMLVHVTKTIGSILITEFFEVIKSGF